MTIINLDTIEVAEDIRGAISHASGDSELILVLIKGEPYAVTPPGRTRDILAREIALRIAQNPTVLTELQKRLEEEEPEDWDN